MAIDLATGFNIGSKDVIDERQVLTLEQMKNLDESIYPDNYFAICKDDGKLYIFNSSNEVNDETGKFRVLEGSAVGDGTVDLSGYVKTYTSLDQLRLTIPVSVGEIYNCMPDNTIAMLFCENIDNYITDVPVSWGILTIKKNNYYSFSIEYQNSFPTSAIDVKRWIGTLQGNNGTGLTWKELSNKKIYTSISELGLSTDNSVWDVINALGEGETASIRSDVFTNHTTMFPTEESGVLSIVKGNDDTYFYGTKVTWVSKSGLFATGILGSGTFEGWNIIGGDKAANKNLIFNNKFKLNDYNLLAKIILPDSGIYRHNIRITCANKNDASIDWTFEEDIDICKFDLHFTNPPLTAIYVQDPTIKLYGLTLYEYPFPEGTDDGIKKISENIRLYYDKTSYTIYVYLMNLSEGTDIIGKRLIGVTLENKGDIEIADSLKSSAFWTADWNHQYALEDIELEAPTIVKVGGDAGEVTPTTTYTSLTELNSDKGTSIELVVNTDNTLKIVEALDDGEEFVEWFGNSNDRFGLGTYAGGRINYLRIQKTNATNGIILAVTDYGKTFSRVYNNGTLENWCYDKTKATLVKNTATLKLDVTKKVSAWYGAIKLTYLYDTSPAEIEITFKGATDDLRWTHINGQKYVKQITFTQDSSDTKHYTIGIEFAGTTYGNYQAEVIGDFADINSLTNEAFTGDKTAVYKTPHGKNNGVTLISELKDLGLTAPCTTAQIAQAMRNITIGTIRTSLIGILDGNNTIITDAPSRYGTLIIHAHGYDGIDIRYTGISGHSATDTWIGKIKANTTSDFVFESVTWEEIYIETESKKEENSYIPDMYDRNANGDIPVVPFDRLANQIAIRQNGGLVSTTETEATYDEDYVGGYVFMGANDILVKNKEMFNKIKVLVHIPGVLRIGIVNDKILEANPRYSTCLVKWLVADFVAFTGMKEYDIEDTILEEGQSIFLECRVGVSSWYLNTGEAKQVGAVTYPASSCTTGLNVTDTLDATANNALFKSQKVNSSSCLTSFGNHMYSIGGKIRGNFATRAFNSAKGGLSKEAYENTEYFGGLNVGLYRRTKYSDTRFCKCVENCNNVSVVGNGTSYTKIYASLGQEALEGKSVYAFKLDVNTIGNITIYHMKGTTTDTAEIIDKYTHYVRAKGLQTIHLPFDIKLGKGEYIAFGGVHCKSTSDNVVQCECKWHYKYGSRVSWMNTYDTRQTNFYNITVDLKTYPEKITSISENTGYINVELICRGEKKSPLEDKYISFTGDSITTFAGFCTTETGYPEGNPAGDNAVYYPASGKVVNNVDATWWGILARDNRMKILRNDAWSGSRVSSTEGSTDTKCLCGTKRRYYLRNGYEYATNSTYPFGRPEIVVSMIGTNDLSGGVELGQEMFKGVTGAEEEYKTILSAFSLFCRRIHDQEGNGGAKIVHFLIPRGSDYGYANANGVTIADLSLHFERIAKAWGQYFIPLSYFNGIKPNTPKCWSCPTGSMFKNTGGTAFPSADGLHPNAMGMEVIADGVHRFLCSIM